MVSIYPWSPPAEPQVLETPSVIKALLVEGSIVIGGAIKYI